MTSLPIRRRDFATAQFAGWLARMGAEVGVPTNPYEVVRYRAYFDGSRQATTHIVYAKEDGRLTFTGGSRKHYEDFLAGRDMGGKDRQPPSLAVPKLVPSKGDKRREKLLERDGDQCWFCGLAMGADCTIEHLVPRSRGGSNGLANFALAHRVCNNKAANLPLIQKIELRAQMRAASCDRSGEADETATQIAGSAEGESAVPAQQGDAQPTEITSVSHNKEERR